MARYFPWLAELEDAPKHLGRAASCHGAFSRDTWDFSLARKNRESMLGLVAYEEVSDLVTRAQFSM
jgi:hypothetical protein